MNRNYRSRLLIIGSLFLTLLLTACVDDGSDDAVQLNVRTNQEFVITLNSNPTTGYQWNLTQAGDKSVILPLGATFKPEVEAEGLVGVGGQQIFLFRGLKPGKTTLTFVHSRPWEKIEPLEERRFLIKVE